MHQNEADQNSVLYLRGSGWKTAEPRLVIVHVSGCLLARTRYLHFRYPVITSRIPVCPGTLFCPGGGATQRRACNPIKASRRRRRRRRCCSCCCCSLDSVKASCFYTRPLRMEPLSVLSYTGAFSWS